MKLEKELKLAKPLKNINHETLLNILRTYSLLMRYSDRFFSKYKITDIQFNILMTLNMYPTDGLSQQELSEKLIVTKSNIVGLVDRLEKINLVERKSHPTDRRINKVIMTKEGKKLVNEVKDIYFKEVDKIIDNLTSEEKKHLINAMGKIRAYLKEE